MKKRRRIEITAFCRRTTIVMRDNPEGAPVGPPPRHVDASHPAPADTPPPEGGALNRPGLEAPPRPREIPEGRKEDATKNQVGRLS